MTSEKARLARLRRLERIRDIAKQTAANEAAEAESTLAQLRALVERTQGLAAGYANRREVPDGASLRQLGRFVAELGALNNRTMRDAETAKNIADAKLAELASAERRRAAVEDRADRQAREIARHAQPPVVHARRSFGTDLD